MISNEKDMPSTTSKGNVGRQMPENVDRIHDLGLVLDHDRHRATWAPEAFIELGGQIRLWRLLTVFSMRRA